MTDWLSQVKSVFFFFDFSVGENLRGGFAVYSGPRENFNSKPEGEAMTINILLFNSNERYKINAWPFYFQTIIYKNRTNNQAVYGGIGGEKIHKW